MTGSRRNDQCIERVESVERRTRRELAEATSRYFYSVQEYEDARRRARSLSNPRALAFHGVGWAEFIPRVEQLTTEWERLEFGYVRICDWDVYDAQMRELIGIA